MDQQHDTISKQVTDPMDPADRLENALNRIAYALDRRATADERPDWQMLAANIDALRARIRNALGPDDGAEEG